MKSKNTPYVVIPVYNPPELFWPFVRRLKRHVDLPLLVVNDGSHAGFSPRFDALQGLPDTTVVTHVHNRGKGAAIKTAITHVTGTSRSGIITVDADGQHETDDILRLTELATAYRDRFYIGTRLPRGDMPLRSRTGNAVTRTFLHLIFGAYVRDTQSGLRYLPPKLMALCQQSVFDKYDFELDMIIRAFRAGIPFEEFAMRPIYINRNASSHYKTVRDSWHVATVFFHNLGLVRKKKAR